MPNCNYVPFQLTVVGDHGLRGRPVRSRVVEESKIACVSATARSLSTVAGNASERPVTVTAVTKKSVRLVSTSHSSAHFSHESPRGRRLDKMSSFPHHGSLLTSWSHSYIPQIWVPFWVYIIHPLFITDQLTAELKGLLLLGVRRSLKGLRFKNRTVC